MKNDLFSGVSATTIHHEKNTLSLVVTALLVLLFMYTAMSKLIDFETFRGQLQHSPLLKPFSGVVAPTVPLLEIMLSLLLLDADTRRIGLIGSAILLVCFTVYLTIAIASGLQLPCSCGGIVSSLSWPQHILLNSTIIILIILTLFKGRTANQSSIFRRSFQK